ncbi:Oxygen regulatory protein NreC [subsurface metagenome]
MKNSATDEIVRAIGEVYRGRYFLSPDISGYIVQGFLFGETNTISNGINSALTRRQREILKLICDGCTDKDIARLLNISPNTVHVHKNNIMERIDIHTKAGLIRYAIRVGIVQIDPIK